MNRREEDPKSIRELFGQGKTDELLKRLTSRSALPPPKDASPPSQQPPSPPTDPQTRDNGLEQKAASTPARQQSRREVEDPEYCRYDFDLAEFPLFDLTRGKNARGNRSQAGQGKVVERFTNPEKTGTYASTAPIRYADTIKGRNGETVDRSWTLYPRAGVGGESTQDLLFDLLQLYLEQGAVDSQIEIGKIGTYLRRRLNRVPSKNDYLRLRRDLDILRAYEVHCVNAFYDTKAGKYVHRKWHLFGTETLFTDTPGDDNLEQAHGFLEVSSTLREIARSRGFFSIGLEREHYDSLKPMEKRLAVYLARKFRYQKIHSRWVEELVAALPITANRPNNVRAQLRKTAEGLVAKKDEQGKPLIYFLKGFKLEKPKGNKRWRVTFERRAKPKSDARPSRTPQDLAVPDNLEWLLFRVDEALKNQDDRRWRLKLVSALGPGGIDRALGQLKERIHMGGVKNPAAMFTKICKDIARENGIVLN